MPAMKANPGLALVIAALALGTAAAQDSAIFDAVAMRDVKTRELMTAARIAVFGGPGGVALPDNYLRIDTAPFGRRLNGVSGSTGINRTERANGQTSQDPSDARNLLFHDRAQLARLMLGVAAYTSPALPVALSTRDTPQAMPGPSDPLGIDVTGDHGFEGFVARLVLDAKSRTPGRVVFWDADRVVLTTTFSNRKSVGGMKAPYRIVTTAGERIVDELLFDEVAVNPKMTKADFIR